MQLWHPGVRSGMCCMLSQLLSTCPGSTFNINKRRTCCIYKNQPVKWLVGLGCIWRRHSWAVSLVSVRNANNSDYPSWENWKANVEIVSHIVRVWSAQKTQRKPNNQLTSDSMLSALVRAFICGHCMQNQPFFRGSSSVCLSNALLVTFIRTKPGETD